jgi:hypothetical protein
MTRSEKLQRVAEIGIRLNSWAAKLGLLPSWYIANLETESQQLLTTLIVELSKEYLHLEVAGSSPAASAE